MSSGLIMSYTAIQEQQEEGLEMWLAKYYDDDCSPTVPTVQEENELLL